MTPSLSTIRTADDAFALYDALPAVPCEAMRGHWRGQGVPTGHRMDGLLEAYRWYGKSFIDADTVHPLVFGTPTARYQLDPWRLPLGLSRWPTLARSSVARLAMALLTPLLRTSQPRARLRAMEVRGVVTATMLYDHLPIQDSFRRLDDRRVLGLMDKRGDAPFFFLLERDDAPR
jgi:hypothetical protein